MIERLYFGFDGLDVSFQGRIKPDLLEKLTAAKEQASAEMRPSLIHHGGVALHVAESGARGGYAFRCDTGEEGATWFFKKSQKVEEWNIRVSLKSLNLALNGLGKVRGWLYETLEKLGADVLKESIGRVDYCVDFITDDFVLDPTTFVMHSHCNRRDVSEVEGGELVRIAGKSGLYTSVTVGEMPGRQVIIYDKTREIIAHQKKYWWEIWNAHRVAAGKEPLDQGDKSIKVWRIEARAGKTHLKERCGISTWQDLDAKFGNVLAETLSKIRMTIPGDDSNRSRWETHPIWQEAQRTVATDLFEMMELEPSGVREVRRAQLADTFRALITGMAASYAMATGTDPKDVAEAICEQVKGYVRGNRDDFQKKIKRAKAKYHFYLECEDNGSIDQGFRGLDQGGYVQLQGSGHNPYLAAS